MDPSERRTDRAHPARVPLRRRLLEPKGPPTRPTFTLLISLLIAVTLIVAVASQLRLGFQLTDFLPLPANPAERLIVDRLGNSPGGRMVLAAVSGGDREQRVAAVRAMQAALAGNARIASVTVGPPDGTDEAAQWLVEQRLLLTDIDPQRFSADDLNWDFSDRMADVTAAGDQVVLDVIARDPQLFTLEIAQSMLPADGAETYDGIWVEPERERAIFVIEVSAAGFDIESQGLAIESIDTAFAVLQAQHPELSLQLTGPSAFAARAAYASQQDARKLTTIASIVLGLLLWILWRDARAPLWAGVSLSFGVAAGLLAMALFSREVHGLTLAFGFTVLGVALDYPLHWLAHRHNEGGNRRTSRAILKPLLLGLASSVLAYGVFVTASAPGLRQLGVFTIGGLIAAALATLIILPRVVTTEHLSPRFSVPAGPGWRWFPAVATLVAVVTLFISGKPVWNNDLQSLSPVPRDWVVDDEELRAALGAADVRYLVLVQAPDVQDALQRTEALDEVLAAQRDAGQLAGWQSVTRLLPSEDRQRDRQRLLPEAATLTRDIDQALSGLPFKTDFFAPFVADVAAARSRQPLTLESLRASPLAGAVDTQLVQDDGQWLTLTTLRGIQDAPALGERIESAVPDAHLINLKTVSENMVTAFRSETLWRLSLMAIVIAIILTFGQRSISALVAPVGAVTLTATLFVFAGQPLTVMQMIGLLLVGGVGLDYAVFARSFAHGLGGADARLAMTACALSTGGVFGILSFSSIPLLSGLGQTVALGIVLAWLMTWITTHRDD